MEIQPKTHWKMKRLHKNIERLEQCEYAAFPRALIVIGSIVLVAILVLCCGLAQAYKIDDVVSVARSQIGKGEVGGDNLGPQVKQYTKGKEVSWCAGFVSWTLTKAGKIRGNYYLSARSYWNMKSRRVEKPLPGDIICFWRGNINSKLGHVGIVESVSDENIVCIEGNSGKYPSKVKRVTYKMGKIKNLLGFVRF